MATSLLTIPGQLLAAAGGLLAIDPNATLEPWSGPRPVVLRLAGITAGGDHTAFIDGVVLYQYGTALSPNPVANPSFETPRQADSQFTYLPSGTVSGWLFDGPLCGVAAHDSAFGNDVSPVGDRQVGFVQNEQSAVSQTIQLRPGTYQVRFYCCQRFSNEQRVQVSVNGNVVGIASPPFEAGWVEYLTPAFTIA